MRTEKWETPGPAPHSEEYCLHRADHADALPSPRRRYHFMIAFFIYDYA